MSQQFIAIDIGGTFTDMAAIDMETGELQAAKRLTTYDDLFRAIDECVDSKNLRLKDAVSFKHGTTLVINALIQRAGARTALITTRGFRDVIEIGRGNRPLPFQLGYRRDELLVPRELRFELDERMGNDGSALQAPSRDDVIELVMRLRAEKVESVAVSFINAYACPDHEQAVAQWLRELLPEVFVCSGSALSREWYEYERSITAAANAFVGPQVARYVKQLGAMLDEREFTGPRFFMGSGTGAISLKQAAEQPVRLVESGPVGGLIGAAAYAAALGIGKMIAFDIGGTTAKCALVQSGEIDVKSTYWIGGYERGFPIRSSIIDIVEVGAGGGSIAQVDEAGRLRVGPQSAGSTPGPVAYGRGGQQPTVTDANVALGRIAPDHFLGDGMRLDVTGARLAILTQLGKPLGYEGDSSIDELACGVLSIASVVMASAIRKITIERGEDPRDFAMLAYGGGGPLHSVELARELNIPLVVIPKAAGIFSAVGMLFSDLESDAGLTFRKLLSDASVRDFGDAWELLKTQASEGLGEESASTAREFHRSAALRYQGQMHTLRINMLEGDDAAAIRARFEATYTQRYGHAQTSTPLEFVSLSLKVRVPGRRPSLLPAAAPDIKATPIPHNRRVFMAVPKCWQDVPVYRRDDLPIGFETAGPVVVEDYGSTCLADVGDMLQIGQLGEIRIRVGTTTKQEAAL